MAASADSLHVNVELVKRKLGGLGFIIKRQPASQLAVIGDIVRGSVAEESGLLQVGDVLLEVNGASLENTSYDEVLNILARIPTGSTVGLKIRVKDNDPRLVKEGKDATDKEETAALTIKTPEITKPSEGKIHVPNGDIAIAKTENEHERVGGQAPGSNGCSHIVLSRVPQQNPKYIKLQNLIDGRVQTDTLHQKVTIQPLNCTAGRCQGSLMQPYGGDVPQKRPYGIPRPAKEVMEQATDFIAQYYTSMKLENKPAHHNRLAEVTKEIEETGIYELTEKELNFGAKTAWRNAARCIGRIQWNKLQLFDARDVNTVEGMFDSIITHIKYATNKGKLRSTITVFPQRRHELKDFRVWNPQLIRYAGYRQPNGTTIGDPSNVEFTEICQQLGWQGKGTQFDVLPLVLQANGEQPKMFDIPEDLVLEVSIKHPKYPWFEEFGLKWYALPAVSCLCLDVGGVEFPACPFNGWYMVTEVGSRDLGDPMRYNMLEPIAKKMGLDTKSNASLWKDLATAELNVAVLTSFQRDGVTMTDHHSASDSFMKHMANEVKLRGGCPADWVWIVPPASGSATAVFHQEMLNYSLKPSYEYQDDPWKHFSVTQEGLNLKLTRRRKSFKEVAKAVKFSAKLFGKAMAKRPKALILYATETGRSENYANMLKELFSHAFDPKVKCMDEYSFPELQNEQLVLIVTSTFGNGDPPDNGEAFARYLYELRNPQAQENRGGSISILMQAKLRTKKGNELIGVEDQPLANVRYSVFGLGSRAYPNFCAFARSLDKFIGELGGEQMLKLGEGDELCGQEESFKTWAKSVFKASCDTFCVGENINPTQLTEGLNSMSNVWSPDRYRFTNSSEKPGELCANLSHTSGKSVCPIKVISVENLQSPQSNRSTILVRFDAQNNDELTYAAGDHLAVFPANRPELVDALIKKLHKSPNPDKPIDIEVSSETKGLLGPVKSWKTLGRFPSPFTIREAFSRFTDIASVPTSQVLSYLSTQTTDTVEQEILQCLGKGESEYEDWKYEKQSNIVEVIEEFPSLKVSALMLLSQMPLLQPRFYSISSSPDLYRGEIHATVSVVQFKKRADGKGPTHFGVCSTWLNSLKPGDLVPCYVRQAHSFHMPEDGSVPIIMVGPGTGIAPFRSFWQQRQFDMQTKAPPIPRSCDSSPLSSPLLPRRDFQPRKSVGEKDFLGEFIAQSLMPAPAWGEMVLFFGCRSSEHDYIYKDEIAAVQKEGALTDVWTALSREPNKPKRYVQDLLKQEANDICDKLLTQGAHFYVCGDVSMAADVYRTLHSMLEEFAAMSPQEVQEYTDKLKSQGRFHEDIFGVTLKTREVTDRVRTAARRAWVCIAKAGKLKKLGKGRFRRKTTDEHDDKQKAGNTKYVKSSYRRPPLKERTSATVLMMSQEEEEKEIMAKDIMEQASRRLSVQDN